MTDDTRRELIEHHLEAALKVAEEAGAKLDAEVQASIRDALFWLKKEKTCPR